MNDLTREQRLLMNLARASSAGKQSRQLEQFFDGLDNTAWLIELSRVHLRLCTGVAQPHNAFALLLQLREGRSYRLALTRDDEARARMADLARAILKLDGEQAATRMQRTAEFQRLQRALAFNYAYGTRRRGRALSETFYANDAAGEEIEALRVRARLKIKDWAVRIGTSENTYRRRLDDRIVPPEWIENAKVVVAKIEDAVLASRAADQPVSDAELAFAFGRVWESYTAQTDRLHGNVTMTAPSAPESEADRLTRQARDNEELIKFVPSAEEDIELDIDVGSIDEVDRAQPEELDGD